MRVLALDIGKVRTGVAVSDAYGRVATPLCVLDTALVGSQDVAWLRVLDDWQPEALLVGLPLTLAGGEGSQARRIRACAASVSEASGLPLYFTDERLSSEEAKRSLHESGLAEREMRGKVDMIAASLFLQAWLDSKGNEASGEEADA